MLTSRLGVRRLLDNEPGDVNLRLSRIDDALLDPNMISLTVLQTETRLLAKTPGGWGS